MEQKRNASLFLTKGVIRVTCNEVRELMDEWVHDELDENHRRVVEEHLCSCAECEAAFRAEKALSELLGSSSPEPSVSISSSVLSVIRKQKQKSAREKMRTFTKYASVAAMLVLVIGITSALVYTGFFRRSGNLTEDPTASSEIHTPDDAVSENAGSVERFLSGYPGTEAFVIREDTDVFEKLGISGNTFGTVTAYHVIAEQKDTFLSLCNEKTVTLSDIDEGFEISDDLFAFLKDFTINDGDVLVFMIRN